MIENYRIERFIKAIALWLACMGFFLTILWTASAEADIGLLVDEYTKGGKRFCVYDVAGEEVIITVDYAELCALTVDV